MNMNLNHTQKKNLKKKSQSEEFDLDEYMTERHYIVSVSDFSEEDFDLIDNYGEDGLLYHKFNTIFDETIKEYYEFDDKAFTWSNSIQN